MKFELLVVVTPYRLFVEGVACLLQLGIGVRKGTQLCNRVPRKSMKENEH